MNNQIPRVRGTSQSARRWKILAATTTALLGLSSGSAFARDATQLTQDSATQCTPLNFPTAGGFLAATACLPAHRVADTVMVLMPGSNYDKSYWDFDYQPETYSFRRAMNAAGYATVIVDRLGSGTSSRAPSTQVTSTLGTQNLHELVQALHRGFGPVPPMAKVVTGGHSLSSGIAVLEATQHHDVQGVLLTGYSHSVNVPGALGIVSTYQPADRDPRFAGRGYDPGWLVSRPGTRIASFYAPDDVDPGVLARDEATKATFAATEYPDGLTSTLPPMTRDIDVPVLVTNGGKDRLCDPGVCATTETLRAEEAPHFSPAAHLRTYVLPGSGHSLNLARNTRDYQAAVTDWMREDIAR